MGLLIRRRNVLNEMSLTWSNTMAESVSTGLSGKMTQPRLWELIPQDQVNKTNKCGTTMNLRWITVIVVYVLELAVTTYIGNVKCKTWYEIYVEISSTWSFSVFNILVPHMCDLGGDFEQTNTAVGLSALSLRFADSILKSASNCSIDAVQTRFSVHYFGGADYDVTKSYTIRKVYNNITVI